MSSNTAAYPRTHARQKRPAKSPEMDSPQPLRKPSKKDLSTEATRGQHGAAAGNQETENSSARVRFTRVITRNTRKHPGRGSRGKNPVINPVYILLKEESSFRLAAPRIPATAERQGTRAILVRGNWESPTDDLSGPHTYMQGWQMRRAHLTLT